MSPGSPGFSSILAALPNAFSNCSMKLRMSSLRAAARL